jgi:oxygen-independent coproporphyrinogen III oxidase
MLGLYLHIPFCAAICNYCNFNRGLLDADLKRRYVRALVTEIEKAGARSGQAGGEGEPADTIYFGGGTPSLLEPYEVAQAIDACRDAFDMSRDCEITLEANPETVTVERLAGFRAAGVNRLSFGVQSFRDDELKRLSRLHSASRASEAFREARLAGFANISLDLMMWLPEQSVEDWLSSVDAAASLAPEHLSLYLLELYPNAPLKEEMARSRWSLAPDDDAAVMYLEAMDRLDAAGYGQYEISNVAKAGFRSRHNLKYWTDGEWLGFGCGAHSTRSRTRWKNVSATDEYVARVERGDAVAVDLHPMSASEHLGDALFTGLRLTDGIDEADVLARFGVDIWARYGSQLDLFLENGVITRIAGRLRLTRRGMLVANDVMTVFV